MNRPGELALLPHCSLIVNMPNGILTLAFVQETIRVHFLALDRMKILVAGGAGHIGAHMVKMTVSQNSAAVAGRRPQERGCRG